MMRLGMTWGVCLLITLPVSGQVKDVPTVNTRERVQVACSEFPPYVYQENGEIKGFGYQITKEMFQRANIPFAYRIIPWARVYDYGLKKRNFLLGCLGRTPKREATFHWIGPISRGVNVAFYQLNSNPIQIETLDELKKFQIGVQRASYSEDFLRQHHFPDEHIITVTSTKQLVLMLKEKRYKFFLLDEPGALKIAANLSVISNSLKEADPLKEAFWAFSVQDYLAFGPNTDPQLVEKLQQAYRALMQEGRIDAILDQAGR